MTPDAPLSDPLNQGKPMKLFNVDGALIHEDPEAQTDGELVQSALKAGKSLHRADLARADLTRANLADANLAGANLARADLAGADLAGAYLARANLADANLARADLAGAYLAGADLTDAYLADAYLADANLAGANLTRAGLAGANLADANLAGANLAGANLVNANLTRATLADAKGITAACFPGLPIPSVHDIHKRLYAAVTATGCALDMNAWHTCETTHCRAGWAVTLAGEAGKILEYFVGTPVAATLIYQASDPTMTEAPDFYADDDEAMEDIKKMAGKT